MTRTEFKTLKKIGQTDRHEAEREARRGGDLEPFVMG